jgi:hypothetical protein
MKMMLQEFLLELYKTKNKKKKNLSWSYMTAMVHGCCKKIKTLKKDFTRALLFAQLPPAD